MKRFLFEAFGTVQTADYWESLVHEVRRLYVLVLGGYEHLFEGQQIFLANNLQHVLVERSFQLVFQMLVLLRPFFPFGHFVGEVIRPLLQSSCQELDYRPLKLVGALSSPF